MEVKLIENVLASSGQKTIDVRRNRVFFSQELGTEVVMDGRGFGSDFEIVGGHLEQSVDHVLDDTYLGSVLVDPESVACPSGLL